MRNHVINKIVELAGDDSRISLVTSDLGFGVVEGFQQSYPERFINVGISEQAMTSVAAGLALEGMIAFTYSIGNFPTLRCIEQIRNDVCYHNANVKVIAVGSGFAYGQLGMSHHATEDIAAMRALPNMRVFTPADPEEAVAALLEAYHTDGPCYIRLGKNGEPRLHPERPCTDIRKAITLREGAEVNILAAGTVLSEAKKAAEILNEKGIGTGVYSFPTVKPIDEEKILHLAEKSKILVTIEEHNEIGGFGGAVAEVTAGMSGNRAKLIRVGLPDVYTGIVGNQDYLRDFYGINAEKVAIRVEKELGV